MEKSLSLFRLNTSMLAAYGSELVHILTVPSMESYRGDEHIALFLEKHAQYSSSFTVVRRSNEPIRKLDRNRDRAFLRLRHLIIAALYSPSDHDVLQGKLLMGLIKRCGNRLNAKRNLQETLDIQQLLLHLGTESATSAIEQLGLRQAVAEFESVQALFYDASNRKIDLKNELRQTPPPSSLKKEYEAAIREIWMFVEAMTVIAPSEAWTRTLSNIEAKNKEYRAKMKHQKTFRDKKKAKKASPKPSTDSGISGEAPE
ncbi:DUF6261 family protein [uncultured Acetobacteroides sp.]|uniref:DUF6261 family protein n=1 Tax=uncultured Acetobacteroides sp. TaxID=1760811 RepID=UPI0029F50716|nr:DUF6261 family protein [uncultured Acetobacteroides sp.]